MNETKERQILVNGKETICRVVGADGKEYFGGSKCNATDKFDYNVGAKIAINRAELARADGEETFYANKIAVLKEKIADYEKKIEKLETEKLHRGFVLESYLELE